VRILDLDKYYTIKQAIDVYNIAESTIRMAAKNNSKTNRFKKNELIKIGRDWFILKESVDREWGVKKKVIIVDNINII
jgi:hypothetical protein